MGGFVGTSVVKMGRILSICIGWAFLVLVVVCEEDLRQGSFSFYRFKGPVSGRVERIVVPDRHGHGQKIDFLAKPDYTYAYGVKDPLTGNNQEHQESRDGNTVHGEYRVLQPDGTTRVVRYTADPHNGFQASVEYHR